MDKTHMAIFFLLGFLLGMSLQTFRYSEKYGEMMRYSADMYLSGYKYGGQAYMASFVRYGYETCQVEEAVVYPCGVFDAVYNEQPVAVEIPEPLKNSGVA